MDLIEILSNEWAMRALIASSMVGIMCGVLGCFIVLRNMSLIGDALAHAILPGVVIAFIFVGQSTLGFFVGSVTAGLFTAFLITWIQHNVKTKNDAAIGIVFTAMFSIGVIGISWISRNQGVHLDLKDFLFGNVLGVSNEDIWLTTSITIYVLLSVVVFYRYLFITTFQPTIAATMGISVKLVHYFLMLLLSFAVVASLRTVGVILVVAMLITPASTALLLTDKLQRVLVISGILGFITAASGLILAIVFETTPGPAMVVVATFLYFTAVIFAPSKGLLFKYLRKRKLQKKINKEDILQSSLKLKRKGAITVAALSEKLSISPNRIKRLINELSAKKMISLEGNEIKLSKSGNKKATELVRAHRLWETFLVNKMGLKEGQIHEDAHKFEHLLTEDLLDEIDADLDFPKRDPHGSPIPSKVGYPDHPLAQLKSKSLFKISQEQVNDQIMSELWELGLLPDTELRIKSKNKEKIVIDQKGDEIQIPIRLAKMINTKN